VRIVVAGHALNGAALVLECAVESNYVVRWLEWCSFEMKELRTACVVRKSVAVNHVANLCWQFQEWEDLALWETLGGDRGIALFRRDRLEIGLGVGHVEIVHAAVGNWRSLALGVAARGKGHIIAGLRHAEEVNVADLSGRRNLRFGRRKTR
jgi:hypothetical protein